MSGRRCDPALIGVTLDFLFRGNRIPSPKANNLIAVLPRCCPNNFFCQGLKNRAEILNQNQIVAGEL